MRKYLLIKPLPGPANDIFNASYSVGQIFEEHPNTNSMLRLKAPPWLNGFPIYLEETSYFKELP